MGEGSNKVEQQSTAVNWDAYIDHLVDVMKNIPLHKVTILTGRNGGGKSMMRKLMPQFLQMREELKDMNRNHIIASTSMERRSCIDSMRAELAAFDRDLEWLPTSENTFENVSQLLSAVDRFLIIDEIEIGMGEELQAGFCEFINQKLDENRGKYLGVLVITHSRTIVRSLHHDEFINLEGQSEDEWLNREVNPMSPDELKRNSDELYRAFEKRLKKR